jgi:serine/threonine protein kinase
LGRGKDRKLNHLRTYGYVYKAKHKETGMPVAIKKFKESDDDEYVRLYLRNELNRDFL